MSPIRYLAEIEHLALLPPPDWLRLITADAASDDPALLALDDGEKAAIALGVSIKADLLLIDERKGAAVAQQKGLKITGTLGILVLASRRQMIDLAEAFSRLQRTNFHCSEDLLAGLLAKEAGQRQ